MSKRLYEFDCSIGGEKRKFFVRARCLEIAIREARHRFRRQFSEDDMGKIDLSSGAISEDRRWEFSL